MFLALFGKNHFFIILTLTLDFAPLSPTAILDFLHCLNVSFPTRKKHGL